MTKLTQQYLKEIFDYKEGFLYWKVSNSNRVHIGNKAGTLNNGYCQIRINNKNYLAHRLIFLYYYNYLPNQIDHIDGNKNNNNIKNLREVTRSQNSANSKSKIGSSKYKGVHWAKQNNKWVSRIGFNNKLYHIGYFTNEKDAAIAYNEKAIELFGEYANLNKV